MEPYWTLTDRLGTPKQVFDKNNHVVWGARHSLYGEAEVLVAEIDNNIRFPGQYFDSESGLHYNYYRYYDPYLGRYLQSDPIGLGDGPNTYHYVYGNPVSYTDPLGLKGGKYGLCGLIALADGPEPFVADAGALLCVCVVALTAQQAGQVALSCNEKPEQCPSLSENSNNESPVDCDAERQACHQIWVDQYEKKGSLLGTDANAEYRKFMRGCMPAECSANF